jgi:N-acetylglucosaminyldiphosphoundecaprenol N-acetyl-beta-D-mannosaminyltransferase
MAARDLAETRLERPETVDASVRPSVWLLGHRVDRLGLEATVDRCHRALLRRERVHHVSLAAAKLVYARDDPRLARVIDSADLVNADGQAVVWASRLLGTPLPERVAGIDLMHALIGLAEVEGFRVFFLGARADVLDRAVENIRRLHPRLEVAGTHHGYFDDDENDALCDEVNAARPDVLFVAMSSPRKEYWVADCAAKLEAPLIVGVGGALDVVAGEVARAPRWLQRAGLEWAFRLAQEPQRLWKRYLVTNTRFVLLVVGAFARRAVGRGE